MKKALYVIGSIILLIIVTSGDSKKPATKVETAVQVQEATPTELPPPTGTATQKTASATSTPTPRPTQTNTSDTYTVTHVVDGDTIDVDFDGKIERIRYIGIDTPETVDPRKPVQCFGKEASVKNKELVLNKQVRLETDVTDRDRYGRMLRYVYLGDTFINLELVKTGYASVYTYPPDVKYDKLLLEAQKTARGANLGLWGACSSPTPVPSPTPQASSVPQGGSSCLIKGNISTSGEKIYHVPGCGSYEKTQIDQAVGEQWFCTEQQVLNAGWRKALNCN